MSTVGERRWQNAPSLRAYLAALAAEEPPRRDYEPLPHDVRRRERVMLGLRLDEPLQLNGLTALDANAVDRLVARPGHERLDAARSR